MLFLKRTSVFILIAVTFATHGFAQSLADVLPSIPLIKPQADGVLYLNVEAAGIVKSNGKLAFLVNGGGGFLKLENGCITRWGGDDERPVWRVNVPTSGMYRVVINRATPQGRDGTAAINFNGQKRGAVSRYIDSTGGRDIFKPLEMGEINLDAGEYSVDFRPTGGSSPFECSLLVDVRLIPLEEIRKVSRTANDLMKKLDVDKLPEAVALADEAAKLKKDLDRLNKETRRKDFSSFTDLSQFFDYDRSAEELAEADKSFKAVGRQLDDLRLEKAGVNADKLKPDERTKLDAYIAAVATAKEEETKTYPRVLFQGMKRPEGHVPLFPTRRFDELPKQMINTEGPLVKLAVQPPADAAKRAELFAKRNNDAELTALCRDLQKAIIPGTAGLENFEKLFAAGKSSEALNAYRAYYFDKLGNPEKYGAVNDNIRFELTRDRGKGHLLYYPNPDVLENNVNKAAVVVVRNETVVCEVGMPGSVSWVPHGMALPEGTKLARALGNDPFWRTDAGKNAARALEFFRCMTVLPSDRGEYMSGGLFPALFFSYAVSGNKAHLARWCEYADDWCMNAKRDQEDFPYNTRCVTDLEPQQVRAMQTFMRIVLDERPELANDFDAATLARFNLKLMTDYTPYIIRARRAEMANWGIMSLCHQLHLSRFFQEFKAMDYFNREAWRLWGANMIQHQTLDGENFEAWDDGHNYVDIGFALDSIPFGKLPAGMDELNRNALWDHVRVDERSKLVHVSPNGNYWPYWEARHPVSKNTIKSRCRQVDILNRYYIDLVDKEPGLRNRLETILGSGKPAVAQLPDRTSDISPYAGMCYLRESWQPDADYLILQNFRERSQGQEDCSRTMYSLSKNDRILVEAHGLVVDKKPDNRYYGKIMTGGKTDFCGQAGRNVVDSRFHTSASFDFAEGRQDSPYARHRRGYSDVYGLYKQALTNDDPDAIRDVTVLRQVFGVKGEGFWITCDRIENKGGRDHEYTQFFTLPVRISEVGFADRLHLLAASGVIPVEENEKEQRIRTASPGFENVSLYCFAGVPLKFANVLNGRMEHDIVKKPVLETVQAALKAGRTPEQILKKPLQQPVSVRWNGGGDQVFVAALYTRPAVFDVAKQYENDVQEVKELKGEGGVVGCSVVTRTGAQAWFQSGPKPVNKLVCGPVTAEAESLLVVKKTPGSGPETRDFSGIVLGCMSMMVDGKAVKNSDLDFEFYIDGSGSSNRNSAFGIRQSIFRPIDTMRILPEQNVFTDSINVSFDIPTQKGADVEFRYTLDGSEPTLESACYARPVKLEETTVVKVRPFRKGLKETPWHFTGTECGKTISAIFRKQAMLPALSGKNLTPGFKYEYFEGDWPALFSYAGFEGVLEAKSSGSTEAPLEPEFLKKIRTTDRAYAVRYDGLVKVPKTGVYSFHAPVHLYTPTMDAGYDLRVFVDGQEWLPAPELHCENVWCVPLAEGYHRLVVAYVDYRWKRFRNEFWMAWQEEEMWQGVPLLEVSGPKMEKQPLPLSWLKW